MSKKIEEIKAQLVALADQNGDGKINIEDAKLVLARVGARFADDWVENLVWCMLAIVGWEVIWMIARVLR